MISFSNFASVFFLICFVVKVESGRKCYTVDLEPTNFRVRDYSIDSVSAELHEGEVGYHLLDNAGNVLVASNASRSQVCMDDSKDCHYWFIYGSGIFSIISDDNKEAIIEKEVYLDEPWMRRMGHCQHYCDGYQQITFVGMRDHEPVLYNGNNDEIQTLFDKVIVNKSNNYENDNDRKKKGDSKVVMKTACLQPKECYKLIGSSRYLVTSNNNNHTMQEEGSTFHGSATFGDASECHSHCDNTPLLAATLRGREILQVATSVSGSDPLIDVQSPQYKAACWIIHEDSRRVNASDYHIVQRYTLAVMFFTLGGEEWIRDLNFMTPKHECDWNRWTFHAGGYLFNGGDDDGDGVHCNGLGYVSGIVLSSNNLVGTIPFELSTLAHLQYMDLYDNLVSGSIPFLGTLRRLRVIDFQRNALTGSIPESIGHIETLNDMILSDNLLTGNIPFFHQKDFIKFGVSQNMLTGAMPKEISTWTSLAKLSLYNNHLSGTIPEGIGNLTLLHTLYLEENYLVGNLPSKIFELPRLTECWLLANSLTGTIPSQIAIESPLTMLYLQNNRLTGTIPSELSLLENLQYFQLDNNVLSGEIPSNFVNLGNLVAFDIFNNNITGDSPFQDCEHSPQYMEADCDTPQKVSCPCCTACHGIFATYKDDLVCTSGDFTLLFENLDVGDLVQFDFLSSTGELINWGVFSADSTTHKYTYCVSMSGCFQIRIVNHMRKNLGVKVSVNNHVVLQESITELFSNVEFGFHSDRTIQQGACDNFILCDASFQVNSTKRDLVDRLTRITGIQVFDDTSSTHYNAACKWVNFLEEKTEEDYKYMELVQYFYLALIFYETNGNQWIRSSGWVTNTTFCNWYGVECDAYNIVTSIQLRYNKLRGTLPTEIGELRGLEYLILDSNSISGALPLEIGTKMTKLRKFNVSYNFIWGSLPWEFSNLRELIEVDASHNQLTGNLPAEIGNLEKLQVFKIFNNTCAGGLPETFYDLPSLKQLSLGSNLFAGPASRIQELANLELLDLSQNFFTGDVPLGLSQKKLRVLQLSGNQFRGSIPTSIKELTSLETLFLFNNLLTGNLPSQIGFLENLVHVSIKENNIKGLVPSEIGKLKNLTLLHLQSNQLGGSGDVFDYTIGDYISDCGNTFTGPARVECTNCSSCCNVDGDCIRKEITWPGRTIRLTKITPQAFVFVTTFAACLFFLICVVAYRYAHDTTSDFLFCQEFQVQSVYRFFLTNNVGANLFAVATLSIQLVLLSIFLEASDFTKDKNDWEYSMSCPSDTIFCDDNRLISPLAWFAYSCIMFSYLGNDFLESIKMIHHSVILKSRRKGVFAGFVVLYVTICSAVVSGLYNYSTGISNTDILKDAVILLFLNELDERLYSFVTKLRPFWVKDRSQEVKEHFDKMTERHSIRFSFGLNNASATHAPGNNDEEQQHSGCKSGAHAENNDDRQQGLGLNGSGVNILPGPNPEETNANEGWNVLVANAELRLANTELRIAEHEARAREQDIVIQGLKNDLVDLEQKCCKDTKALENKCFNLESEIGLLKEMIQKKTS